MSSQPVLVLGATGRHGGTGRRVAELLTHRGRTVRALVRQDDGRAEALRQQGISTVVADLTDRASLHSAVSEVSAIYFTYPVGPGIIPAAVNLSSVLAESNSPAHLVVMSMGPASPNSPSKVAQAQAAADEVFGWAGLNPTVLRFAGLFHENVLLLHQQTIREQGLIANSFGPGPAPWIGGGDAAEIAVTHLLAPRPDGPQLHYVPPAEEMSHHEVAEIISTETGVKTNYAHVPAVSWRHQLETYAATDPAGPINSSMAQHISELGAAAHQRGKPMIGADPAQLTTLLGRPPATFAEFVHAHRERFLSHN